MVFLLTQPTYIEMAARFYDYLRLLGSAPPEARRNGKIVEAQGIQKSRPNKAAALPATFLPSHYPRRSRALPQFPKGVRASRH
jgi:hypothetical protein